MPATPINATILAIKFDGTKITHQLQAEFKCSMQMRESLTKDNTGYKAKFPGPRDWEMSGEAEFAYDAAQGFAALYAELGNEVEVIFTTSVTGTVQFKGDVLLTELNITAGVEETSKISYTFLGSGAIAKETISAG